MVTPIIFSTCQALFFNCFFNRWAKLYYIKPFLFYVGNMYVSFVKEKMCLKSINYQVYKAS